MQTGSRAASLGFMRKTIWHSLAALAVASMALAGCSSEPAPTPATEGPTEVTSEPVGDVTIIDVRTPEEYAQGHLDGAVLLDLNSGQFEQEFTNLDPDGEYLLYCRSGNRAGQAQALMEAAGFNNVTNLGSLESAADATGNEVVK